MWKDEAVTKVVIIGGGPGGYEAALVAGQLGAEVTLVERTGLGGAAVLTDCVPSKTLIATAEVLTTMERAGELGLHFQGDDLGGAISIDWPQLNRRVLDLAAAQSRDITVRLEQDGIHIVRGTARVEDPYTVVVERDDATMLTLTADIILVATGTTPRELPGAKCDGRRILNWKQLYDLDEVPRKMIVVGSGVTGAEFASAYLALGCEVVLVSSRDQVLPGEDHDAANVLERSLENRGMEIMSRARAESARCEDDGVVVRLEDGRELRGTHVLMAVGSIPSSAGLGLEQVGVELTPSGHIQVDRVSRTSVRNIYAAGDVTGVLPLASVAAMQGRIAMYHSLGDAVTPLDLARVSSNIFTAPEIATVGITQDEVAAGELRVTSALLPLAGNARAKMQGFSDGFVKVYAMPTTGIMVGGVVVAPNASELIHAITVAVGQRLTVDEFSAQSTVYPSMSGSLSEAARRLHAESDHFSY